MCFQVFNFDGWMDKSNSTTLVFFMEMYKKKFWKCDLYNWNIIVHYLICKSRIPVASSSTFLLSFETASVSCPRFTYASLHWAVPLRAPPAGMAHFCCNDWFMQWFFVLTVSVVQHIWQWGVSLGLAVHYSFSMFALQSCFGTLFRLVYFFFSILAATLPK